MQFEQTGTNTLDALRMQYAAVPQVLKDRRQWVLWQRLPADEKGKFGKKPIAPDGSGRVALPHDWTSWGTFEEALACLARAHPLAYGGLGFMMTRHDPYLVVDFDDISACNPAALDGRVGYQNYVADLPTYVEMSPSGRGWHVWVEGHLDGAASEPLKAFAVDFLCHSVFVTVTGRSVGGVGGHVLGGQHLVTYMDDFIRDRRLQVAVNLDVDTHKPLYLTDEELYNQAVGFNSHFKPRYHGLDGQLPGEWSHTFYNVVGTLDKLTGDPAQIRRLIMWSGLVRNSPPDKVGIDRNRKAERIFNSVLLKVRADNKTHLVRNQDPNTCGWAHGKQIWEAIEAEKVRRVEEAARLEAERIAAEAAAAEAYRLQMERLGATGTVVEGYSRQAEEVLGMFSDLTWEARKLTPPPGNAGRLVLSVMDAAFVKDLYFAIPTTLAGIAGIIGRSYKTDVKSGLNLNFLMLGKPGTGKTSALDVWKEMVDDTINNPSPGSPKLGNAVPPLKTHMFHGKASSGHGLHLSVTKNPCATWCLDEAAQQYQQISDNKDKVGQTVQSVVNRLYGTGRHGQQLYPPESMGTAAANMQTIGFPSISMLWACPPDKIEISADAVVSGLLSRLLIINNPSPGQVDEGHDTETHAAFCDEHKQMVFDLLVQAALKDRVYEQANAPFDPTTLVVDTTAVRDLHRAVRRVASKINISANNRQLPEHYGVFVRMAQTTMRLACVLAVLQNRYAPAVTGEMYRWAAGYVVQNLLLLLSGMDSGEVGDDSNDEFKALVRIYDELAKKGAMRGQPGMPHRDLFNTLKCRAPFRSHRNGRTKAASDCLKLAIAEGFIEPLPQLNGIKATFYRKL